VVAERIIFYLHIYVRLFANNKFVLGIHSSYPSLNPNPNLAFSCKDLNISQPQGIRDKCEKTFLLSAL
jgi:hypothetical protein